MKRHPLRPASSRPTAAVLARPRPTAASALLLAVMLSLPFAAIALVQALI
ncbi:hypothetical protein [Antarctobacter heliothermus]|nr:hypothetical protein [Antarctobacter heliothermus]